MAAWRPYSQIVVPDVCFLHSVGNGEPHYGHLHGRSPFPSIAASETRLGSNSERLFVGFHDFGDSTFFPPAPSVFIDTSATGPVEYVEKSGEPLFWIFVTWKIQVRGSPGSLQSWIVTFSKRMCSHFCKTAAYGHASAPLLGSVVCHLWPGKHRRHIRRLPVVLRAGLCAAIFTKRVCRTPYGIVRRPLAFHVSQRVYSLQKLIFTKRLQP